MGEILTIIIIVYLVQACLCGIIHILNNTKNMPTKPKLILTQFLNVFWVLTHLKKYRSGNTK